MNDFNASHTEQASHTADQDQVNLEQLEQLYFLQRNILEDAALQKSHTSVLIKLCQMAEEMVPNSIATIMLLEQSKMNVLVAPSMPSSAVVALNGLKPGPHTGSCGNAVYQKQATFVSVIREDERWLDLQEFAQAYQLEACWSMPIQTAKDEVIGTFALTRSDNGMPSAFQQRLLDTCAYIASIVIRRHQSEEKLEYLAYHDTLTGLPNRTYLKIIIEERIQRLEPFSVVLFGLDRFKVINDSHGHDVGDQVLISCASLLSAELSHLSLVFRISGDEFILLVDGAADSEAITTVSDELSKVFSTPVKVDEWQFYLSGSIGVSTFNPEEPTSFYTLIKQADMAMVESKRQGSKSLTVFKPEMAIKVQDALALEGDIHNAIKNHEFEVYYQPILTTSSQQYSNLEALIRWNHPIRGVISPLAFIPLMEEMGMVHELSKIVVELVLKDLKEWDAEQMAPVKVSINLSGREFYNDQIQDLLDPIVASGRAHQIEFELTENYLMSHAETVLDLMETIRSHGITIAIDDFGTGYSSLAYLKRFPIDKLKIDQSLVRDISEDKSDREIVKAVVALGHALDLEVVAEGIETQDHQDILQEQGVELLQGFLLSKPLPKAMIMKMLLGDGDS